MMEVVNGNVPTPSWSKEGGHHGKDLRQHNQIDHFQVLTAISFIASFSVFNQILRFNSSNIVTDLRFFIAEWFVSL